MQQAILINSYPRSGSAFLGQLLVHMNIPGVYVAIIHCPPLIGIKEAMNVTIVRNPKRSIASNIFKAHPIYPDGVDFSKIEHYIKTETISYGNYIRQAKKTGSYLMNFNSLTLDTEKEVNKFLKSNGINDIFFPNLDNVFDVIEKQKYEDDRNDIYGGHYPRGIEENELYKEIWDRIIVSPAMDMAYELYLDTIKDLS